jgi:hypothetical protein
MRKNTFVLRLKLKTLFSTPKKKVLAQKKNFSLFSLTLRLFKKTCRQVGLGLLKSLLQIVEISAKLLAKNGMGRLDKILGRLKASANLTNVKKNY